MKHYLHVGLGGLHLRDVDVLRQAALVKRVVVHRELQRILLAN